MTSPPPLSEKRLQAMVIKAARATRWMVAHFRPALNRRGEWRTAVAGDGAGFPDLVLVHRETGSIAFIELKTDRGAVSPEQTRWLSALGKNRSVGAGILRPKQLDAFLGALASGHLASESPAMPNPPAGTTKGKPKK